MRTLTLYSRTGCHLCEQLEAELVEALNGRAAVEIVDIDGDPALERRYGGRIPVLAEGRDEISDYPLDRAALEQHLRR